MIKINITNRFNDEVIFSYACDNNTLRITLEQAAKKRVKLFYPAISESEDLSGANLENLQIYADMHGVNLRGANLKGATIYGNLCDADLSGADLTRCYITCEFINARLNGANFEHASVIGCDFSMADVQNVNFKQAYFVNSKLDLAMGLDSANFDGATFLPHDQDGRTT